MGIEAFNELYSMCTDRIPKLNYCALLFYFNIEHYIHYNMEPQTKLNSMSITFYLLLFGMQTG